VITRSGDRFSPEDQGKIIDLHTAALMQQEAILAGHVARMKSGQCSVEAGLLFNDLVAALVKLSALAGFIVKTGRELE
jgi:Na+/phosphate symporter